MLMNYIVFLSGKGKQHATSLHADQTHNSAEDDGASHLGITSDHQEMNQQAPEFSGISAKKVSDSSEGSEISDGHLAQGQSQKHQCQVCYKRFKSFSSLKRHIRVH